MFNGGNLRNRLRVTKRTKPIHSIASSGRGIKQSIPILFPLVSSNDVPVRWWNISIFIPTIYMGIANDKEIYPMMSSKVNEDKGKHWCYWHGPLPLCSLSPPINHLNTRKAQMRGIAIG